ncbi:MAG: hypothetical protein M0D57_16820 [Sphingobacteriales bacterium JAD_PAG50586_3]|nr:MAG: hypothetical protein M0D57_16820 [Sphingobacteriales bacterium JAD_PAG50586_3]
MKRMVTIFVLILLFVTSCNQPTDSVFTINNDSANANKPYPTIKETIERPTINPKFDISIKADTTILKQGEDLTLYITFTNKADTAQMYLLGEDKGAGYWFLSAKVTNLGTKKSAVEYETIAVLNSRTYQELPLGKTLGRGKSVTNKFLLGNIAKYYDYKPLAKGRYSVQLDYNFQLSNTINFEIR